MARWSVGRLSLSLSRERNVGWFEREKLFYLYIYVCIFYSAVRYLGHPCVYYVYLYVRIPNDRASEAERERERERELLHADLAATAPRDFTNETLARSLRISTSCEHPLYLSRALCGYLRYIRHWHGMWAMALFLSIRDEQASKLTLIFQCIYITTKTILQQSSRKIFMRRTATLQTRPVYTLIHTD